MNVRLVQESTTPKDKPLDAILLSGMLTTLRGLLLETCRLRNQGASYAQLSHAQGYADGYMKVLKDAGFVTNDELLQLVHEVRRGVDGPATRTLTTPLAITA